ncbi:hypothetical protein NE237_022647 [Protea cynaroides]|uniref:Thioredoxin-like fold domain-containing protein n=1 Tax=Protea cynaroides TaxID=273540 RepID=A0A9Q0HDE6_9MAGN|nr:hypothetical protein NE237_022647 [Protea cynaroides]
MEILNPKQGFVILSSLLFICNLSVRTIHMQGSIPARFDGFVYKDDLLHADTIMIEAFFDPICPHCRDAWPPLKRVLEDYGPQLSLVMWILKQEKYYNQHTYNMSRASVVDHTVRFVTKAVGAEFLSAVKSGFNDRNSDLATRDSFKYGCSRGVTSTPFFIVNGFPLPNAGLAVDYEGWRSIIDPLINKQRQSGDKSPYLLMEDD